MIWLNDAACLMHRHVDKIEYLQIFWRQVLFFLLIRLFVSYNEPDSKQLVKTVFAKVFNLRTFDHLSISDPGYFENFSTGRKNFVNFLHDFINQN